MSAAKIGKWCGVPGCEQKCNPTLYGCEPSICKSAEEKGVRKEAAKTPSQRVEATKQRKREAGMKEIRSLWAHPEDHKAIRAYVARLTIRRILRMVGKA